MEIKEQNVSREQWMLARSLAGAVNACNAPFCVNEDGIEEVNRDQTYVSNVALELSSLCSRMAIEDTMQILDRALSLKK